MLHAGLDLSRKKLDVCLLSDQGEHLDQLAVAPDVDSLRRLARRIEEVHCEPVCAVIESMTGARIVHDTLEQQGWSVEIADAQKVKGLAPLACKTDKIDSKVLAVLSHRDLVPAIWLPDPSVREGRELARFRLHLVKHKSALKNRIHSTLINFGKPCPVTDLFGLEGRRLLKRLQVPEPWRGNITASIELIDDLGTDKIDSKVLAVLSHRDLVPAIWLPDPSVREERELARFRLHLVKHKSALKNRIHSTLINFGKPCPVTDLFGLEGRRLSKRLQVPEPWRGNITASIELIDDLERQISEINRRLKESHADHPYIPLLLTVPGIGWVLAFTIAAEIGEIERFPSPEKLTGYTGLCPRVNQSGEKDRRGPLTKHGPTYLRWALLEATMHALRHPAYSERYQRTKRRLGKQRGAKVAQVDVARRLSHAIWHMLSRKEKFAPRGAAFRLAA